MSFEKFAYGNLEELRRESIRMNTGLHFSVNCEALKKPVPIENIVIPNSIAAHPMEGCDGNEDGSPSELTVRRYRRFAAGGAGLIWFEAVAAVKEGRASPRQLWINSGNVDKFKALVEDIYNTAERENSIRPVCIMQLTHSGRFSKPDESPAPIISYHNPYLNKTLNIDAGHPVVQDSYIERLEETFEAAAILAKKTGFDGVDVKCCHRYLNSELLSAFLRDGAYGGDFDGRTRFLRNVTDRIRQSTGNGFIVTTRMNIYDGIPYPYGWGVDKNDYLKMDLSEPMKLIGILREKGLKIINLTMGTPYLNPHVNRPYDSGPYVPEEHPIEGVARLVKGIGEIQKAFPDIVVVGTGFSWLRQFSWNLGAGCLENGMATLIGYGREMFAYPGFAADLMKNGSMDTGKCCIACGKCSEIMKSGGVAGCVIRDSEVYAPVYKRYCKISSN